jgi:hypothetical protein
MALDQEAARTLYSHVHEIWVKAELERRKGAGQLPNGFQIEKVQILVEPNGIPVVRLNQEVKAEAVAKLMPGTKKTNVGEPVSWSEIKEIVGIRLTDEDDPNCGHLTMISFPNGWVIGFDFRTNKKLALGRYGVGEDFLAAADACLIKGHYRPLIDNLFSAVELFVTAQLFVMEGKEYVSRPKHRTTSLKYNNFINIGNYKNEYKQLFNKLTGMRDKARYLKGNFRLSEDEAKDMLHTARELARFTKSRID